MRIDTARFVNFNCFEDREFEFAPRFNLVIGDNAKGKTSVLDGLSVGLGSLFLGFPAPAGARSIHRGFWSVWMEVFRDDPDMRGRFLNWFPGTARDDCFDAHTEPRQRANGKI